MIVPCLLLVVAVVGVGMLAAMLRTPAPTTRAKRGPTLGEIQNTILANGLVAFREAPPEVRTAQRGYRYRRHDRSDPDIFDYAPEIMLAATFL